MKVISVHCTGTLVRCTGRGRARSILCGRVGVLSGDLDTIPHLERTLTGPILGVQRGCSLVYATTANSGGMDHRFSHFVALMLGGGERRFLRFVYLSFLSLCQGLGRVKINELAATMTIGGRARRQVHGSTKVVLRTRVRLRAIMSPSVRNNFVFSIGSCHLSTDVAARLGQIGRRFVSGGEEVM